MAEGCRRMDGQMMVLVLGQLILYSAGGSLQDSCRFGTQPAIIRHLVVEKITPTP
jgi:hypothetical protein